MQDGETRSLDFWTREGMKIDVCIIYVVLDTYRFGFAVRVGLALLSSDEVHGH